ncbi:uncharacterized protein (DUF58 family) [Actinoplanes tereljensis]|uniref:Uncharacterized protein n=1 Tax=Paractinoplanes tereljensis TaxID=571912 RepID=A0A919NVN5_9ACTN|nr:hypothetical protein [Actinoplanes tereljensis]GIF24572.1 hypothetical protein Ate02nite_73020 [Actinoplanes tereljensis]
MKWRTSLTSLVLVGLTLVTVGPPSQGEFDAAQLVLTGHDGRTPSRFSVEGTPIQGLFPGAVRSVRLTVVNPERFALRIERLTGRTVATSRRGCPVSGLRVTGYEGKLPVRVQARGRTRLPGVLVVTMPRNTTPKCAETRFVIEFLAVGTRVGR